MSKYLEDEHQTALINWANIIKIPKTQLTIGQVLVHIPNGGKRNAREAARFKKMGVRAGFPDLGLFIANDSYYGLFIEMKRPIIKGKQKPRTQPSQTEWIDLLNGLGYLAVVCYGWQEAVEVIKDYLSIK